MPTALLGAGASILGGVLSSGAQSDANAQAAAGAQFNPFNVSGAGGSVGFDGQNVNVQGDAQSRMFQGQFGNQFQQLANGGAGNQGAIDFGNQMGNNFGNFFNQANQAGDPSSGVNAANQFQNFSNQNALFGQASGIQAFGQANNFANAQGGRNEGLAQGMFGQGQQSLGNTDFSSLAADQLARSRAQAKPGEERAVNSKFQNLFSKGILSSTAGQRQIGELALAQENADINRQFGADQFANQMGQQNQQFGLQAMQQGAGFRNQDDQFNAQRAGFFGQQGQGLMNFGQGSGQSGMNAAFMGNDLTNSRGQQRMANASSLFGFGQQANQQNFNQQMGLFGANSQQNSDLRQLIALGGNLGSAQSTAGGTAGAFTANTGNSPFGSILTGIGSEIGRI